MAAIFGRIWNARERGLKRADFLIDKLFWSPYNPRALVFVYLNPFMSRPVNIFVKMNPKESSEKRVARFKQWFNKSRLNELKFKRYRDDNQGETKRRRMQKDSAKMREHYRAIREKNKFYQ